VTAPLIERLCQPGALTARFQPVLEAGSFRPCYVEGLISGPAGTNLERADVLFAYVRRKRETIRIDRQCVATLLEAARELPGCVAIGLNVEAATLASDADFAGYLRDAARSAGISTSRLILEIVEHTPPGDAQSFSAALQALRRLDVRIALDDVGSAHSNYQMMLETRPDFFKIDRYFVKGAHADSLRREILRSIANLAKAFGARVVAEGIEHRADLTAVREAGIELAQGYLLFRPLSAGALGDAWRKTENVVEGRREDSAEEHGYR
jgi:EAL domain-containing protein (putative c-di-GMP-specific phosphodiesterase class I)